MLILGSLISLCFQNVLESKIFHLDEYLVNIDKFSFKVSLPPTKQIKMIYNIGVKADSGSPIIAFGPQINASFHMERRDCFKRDIIKVMLNSHYYIALNGEGSLDSGCQGFGENFICKGVRKYYTTFPNTWEGFIAYVCGKEQNLTMNLNLTFISDIPLSCEPLRFPYCQKMFGYNQTILPNMLSHTSQKEADDTMKTFETMFNLAETQGRDLCYQYSIKYACYSLFPECRHGAHFLPCRQMCIDLKVACSEIIKLSQQHFYCGMYPNTLDPNICWYEPITCKEPESPDFGLVIYEGTDLLNISEYTCNVGYRLKGDKIRHCSYTGKWNGTTPICLRQSGISNVPLLVAIVFLSMLLVIIFSLCFYFRREMILVIHNNVLFPNRANVIGHDKRKLFITYSSEDADDIEVLLQELKKRLPRWNIVTYQQDFPGGENLLSCIHKGVWESDAVLVYLTTNYVASHWCEFEFTEVRTRSVIEQRFKCIVILPEDIDATFLDGLPGHFQQFVRSRVYLKYGERMFWNKLQYSLRR